MANPTFLFMNPATAVFTGSVGSVGLSNLNDYERDATASTGATASSGHYLQVDLGSAGTVNCVVIDPYQFSYEEAYVLAITASNAENFAISTVVSSSILTTLASAYDSPVMIPLPVSGSYRYIRVQAWDDGVLNVDQPLKLRGLWAGLKLQLDSPFDVPARYENTEYQTFEGVALNGNIRSSQVYTGGRIVNEVRFSLQSDSTADGIRYFVQTVKGKRYPFYFTEDPDGPVSTYPVRLMHFSDDYVPVETVRYNLNSVSMKMRTHRSEH